MRPVGSIIRERSDRLRPEGVTLLSSTDTDRLLICHSLCHGPSDRREDSRLEGGPRREEGMGATGGSNYSGASIRD
ncbi:hypothetical protein IF1G_11409 [Cordyceps javanica]|uniref:Uncharacterized protein n=1 Tax=Cordyceps javanica TaxID=43265 RepID=A0A545UKD2_9HYPO|nr:hypothetical protein IF1G_11409 [Cordyceps javanica]